jgi:hypothetical protein
MTIATGFNFQPLPEGQDKGGEPGSPPQGHTASTGPHPAPGAGEQPAESSADTGATEGSRESKNSPEFTSPAPPPTAISLPEATQQAPERPTENAGGQPVGTDSPGAAEPPSKAQATQGAEEEAAPGASPQANPAEPKESAAVPTNAPDPNAKLTSFSPRKKKTKKVPVSRRKKKAKRAPGISLPKLESRFEKLQAAWKTVDRNRLNVAKQGGLILKDIKRDLKREGKSFAAWHGDQEAAGKINLTLRTLQKWMRVATKWSEIEAKATGMGLDPNELGLDEALELAARPRSKQPPNDSTGGKPGLEQDPNKAGLEAKYKLKITCEVSGFVRTVLTSDEMKTLFNSGKAVLKADKMTIADTKGRSIGKVFDAEAAPEVVVEEWLE